MLVLEGTVTEFPTDLEPFLPWIFHYLFTFTILTFSDGKLDLDEGCNHFSSFSIHLDLLISGTSLPAADRANNMIRQVAQNILCGFSELD